MNPIWNWLSTGVYLIPLLLGSTCMVQGVGGCAQSADHLFQASNPAIKASYSPLFGGNLEVGTAFRGNAQTEFDEQGRVRKLDVEVDSDPVPVIGAEGARLVQMEATRAMEYAYMAEAQRIVGENIAQVRELVDVLVSTVRGSNVNVSGFGVSGSATLGGPRTPNNPTVNSPAPGPAERQDAIHNATSQPATDQ